MLFLTASIKTMDPNTATREEFTNHLLDAPIPDNATEEWRREATDLKDLLEKLAFDKTMEPNLQQTYMTPANSKNKIYCTNKRPHLFSTAYD